MKREFKVGDRVAVYGAGYRHDNMGGPYSVPGCNAWRGTVREFDSVKGVVTQYQITPDGNYEPLWVHPKQCRRLKPRAKPREFWIQTRDTSEDQRRFDAYTHQQRELAPQGGRVLPGQIHVREVRGKSK